MIGSLENFITLIFSIKSHQQSAIMSSLVLVVHLAGLLTLMLYLDPEAAGQLKELQKLLLRPTSNARLSPTTRSVDGHTSLSENPSITIPPPSNQKEEDKIEEHGSVVSSAQNEKSEKEVIEIKVDTADNSKISQIVVDNIEPQHHISDEELPMYTEYIQQIEVVSIPSTSNSDISDSNRYNGDFLIANGDFLIDEMERQEQDIIPPQRSIAEEITSQMLEREEFVPIRGEEEEVNTENGRNSTASAETEVRKTSQDAIVATDSEENTLEVAAEDNENNKDQSLVEELASEIVGSSNNSDTEKSFIPSRDDQTEETESDKQVTAAETTAALAAAEKAVMPAFNTADYSQTRRPSSKQEVEYIVSNRRVARELLVSPEYVKVTNTIQVVTELVLYAVEFTEACAERLVRLNVTQNNDTVLTISSPLRLEGRRQYFVHLTKLEPDDEGLYYPVLEIEAYFRNPFGRLSMENHNAVKEFFAFRTPYETVDMTANVRRVDSLSPLSTVSPLELGTPAIP